MPPGKLRQETELLAGIGRGCLYGARMVQTRIRKAEIPKKFCFQVRKTPFCGVFLILYLFPPNRSMLHFYTDAATLKLT